ERARSTSSQVMATKRMWLGTGDTPVSDAASLCQPASGRIPYERQIVSGIRHVATGTRHPRTDVLEWPRAGPPLPCVGTAPLRRQRHDAGTGRRHALAGPA